MCGTAQVQHQNLHIRYGNKKLDVSRAMQADTADKDQSMGVI